MRLLLICDSRRPRRLPVVSVAVLDDETGRTRRMKGELLVVYDGEAIIETKHGTYRGDAETMRVLKRRVP